MIMAIAGGGRPFWPLLKVRRFRTGATCPNLCYIDCKGIDCAIRSWRIVREYHSRHQPYRRPDGIAVAIGPGRLIQWGCLPIRAPITHGGAEMILDMLTAAKEAAE